MHSDNKEGTSKLETHIMLYGMTKAKTLVLGPCRLDMVIKLEILFFQNCANIGPEKILPRLDTFLAKTQV